MDIINVPVKFAEFMNRAFVGEAEISYATDNGYFGERVLLEDLPKVLRAMMDDKRNREIGVTIFV